MESAQPFSHVVENREFFSPLVIPAIVIRKSSSCTDNYSANGEMKFPKLLNRPFGVSPTLLPRRNSTQSCLLTNTTTTTDQKQQQRRHSNRSEHSSWSADSSCSSPTTTMPPTSVGSKWLHFLFSNQQREITDEKDRCVNRSSSATTLLLLHQQEADSTSSTSEMNESLFLDKMRYNSTPTIINNALHFSNSVSTFFETELEDHYSTDKIATPSSSGEDATELPPLKQQEITTNFYHQLFKKSSSAVAKTTTSASCATLPKAAGSNNSSTLRTVNNSLKNSPAAAFSLTFDPNTTPIAFLTRIDFWQVLKTHTEPRTMYMRSQQLKSMVNRVRRDPSYFLGHCVNHREMTSFLNIFVIAAIQQKGHTSSISLPDGWRMKRHYDGRIMYCQERIGAPQPTTFIDPRLATLVHTADEGGGGTFVSHGSRHEFFQNARRTRQRRRFSSSMSNGKIFLAGSTASAEPMGWLPLAEQQRIETAVLEAAAAEAAAEEAAEIAAAAETTATTQQLSCVRNLIPASSAASSYEDRLIGFIRQPHAMSVMARRYPDLLSDSTLQQYIRRVKRDGRQALRHLSYSIRFAMLISACGHDIEQFHQIATAPSPPSVLTTNFNHQQHLPPSEFSLLCRMLTTASQHQRHRTSSRTHHHHHHHHHRSSSSAPHAGGADDARKSRLESETFLPLLNNSKPPTFAEKVKLFHRHLRRKSRGHSALQKVKLTIKRETCLQDAFDKIMRISRRELAHGCLYVRFEDELGLDYGGPLREFFALLSSELFDPFYGLFELADGESSYAIQVNPNSDFVDDSLKWFRFAGRILALALLHGCLVDVCFTPIFYQTLLNSASNENNNAKSSPSKASSPIFHYKLAHLAPIDPDLQRSLSWLAENPLPETMHDELYFSINQEICGVVEEIDLRPHGRHQPVTNDNKAEYIQLMVQWRCEQRNVSKQMRAMGNGFRELLGYEGYRLLSSLFTRSDELELLLAGLPGDVAVDVGNWRANTEYKGGYDNDSVAVKMFWNIISRCFTEAQRLQLLVFVTGTASLPYDGFGSLRGSSGGLKKFTIEKWDNNGGSGNNKLPRAHTCFNRLDLPPYSDEATMYRKLLMAIEETEAFGIE